MTVPEGQTRDLTQHSFNNHGKMPRAHGIYSSTAYFPVYSLEMHSSVRHIPRRNRPRNICVLSIQPPLESNRTYEGMAKNGACLPKMATNHLRITILFRFAPLLLRPNTLPG